MGDLENFNNFEKILQKKSLKKPSILYSDVNINEYIYNSQDVIQSVYSQIKAIQLADTRNLKSNNIKEKSKFMPIEKMPVYKVPPNYNRFETQGVSDTQLINLVEKVESTDVHTGITQEFDTTFSHNDDKTDDDAEIGSDDEDYVKSQILPCNKMKAKSTKGLKHKDMKSKFSHHNILNGMVVNDTTIKDVDNESIGKLSSETLSDKSKTISNDSTSILVDFEKDLINNDAATVNTSLEIEIQDMEEEEINIDTGQKSQRSPSPVLIVRDRKRTLISPLVVALDTFEKFENIAMPVLEEIPDLATAKQLINSQIMGKELVLNADKDIFGIEGKFSPVLELKREDLKVNSQVLTQMSKVEDNVVTLKDSTDVIAKTSDILKDEILFSSDEEIESFPNEIQDLALTCALETPFYEESEILDKNMYVGFQTASNKSIQICTNSFDKAKTILDENIGTAEEFSLTELVEKYSNFSAENFKLCSNSDILDKASIDFESKPNEYVSISTTDENYIKSLPPDRRELKCKNVTNDPSKPMFQGFMTANNKRIDISDRALERCKNVFKDIDLNENFDSKKEAIITDICNDTDDKELTKQESHQEIFSENINDELLLQEFGNIEMSLQNKENNEFRTDSDIKDVKLSENVNHIVKLTEIVKESVDDYETLRCENLSKICFKTASNKNISVSAKALVKIKNVFQDIELEIDLDENHGTLDTKLKEMNSDFANRSLKRKYSSISNISNIEISLNSVTKKNNDVFNEVQEPPFKGFKTASNNNITVSEQALAKTMKLFDDIDIHPDVIKTNSNTNEICVNKNVNADSNEKFTEFVGFKTANNKSIAISDKALSVSKNVFKDLDKVVPMHKKGKLELTRFDEEHEIRDIGIPSTRKEFMGFKTASHKQIKISDEALIKTKTIFQNIDNATMDPASNENSSFQKFKIARNKNVHISEEVISKSKKLQNEINNFNITKINDDQENKLVRTISNTSQNEKSLEINDKIDKTLFLDFQTASKKPVNVSTDALAKSKKIFQDLDRIEDPKETVCNSENVQIEIYSERGENGTKTNGFVGFKTASNKKVAFSEKALEKSKKILESIVKETEIKLNEPKSDLPLPKTKFKGFQTASYQKTVISEDAIRKTKNIFDDIDNLTKKGTDFGFQTANNKVETVSEESLRKCRQMLSDTNIKDVSKARDNTFANQINKYPRSLLSKRTDKIFRALEDQTVDRNKIATDTNLFDVRLNTKVHPPTNREEVIIDTQILNNFDTSLHTEDFKEAAKPVKRSGSPILSCPRAKRRKKFETPYKSTPKTINFDNVDNTEENKNLFKFRDDYKKTKHFTLKDLYFEKENKIDPYVTGFDLDTLLNFEFSGYRNDLNEGVMGIDDLKKIFLEATNKKLIPEGWLDNHLKLILWKLISYEIKCSISLGMVCTARNVIEQLKYRYDRELFNTERPILRKIFEKDDISTNAMILCVAGIYVDGARVASVTNTANIELLLTDGWYFIRATIDKMLARLVYDGNIVVGCKIVTEGAELMNCEQGVAPWEDTTAVRLSISGNSTRPAKYDSKLGLRPIKLRSTLADITPDGGRVRRVQVLVTRVYPLLYVEKFEDGSTVTRSERLEHLHQIKYEAEREIMIEKIYEQVEKEFSEQESQESEEMTVSSKGKNYESGSQIDKMMKKSRDPMEFRAQLTSSQVHLLQEHTNMQRDKYLQEIQERVRNKLKERNIVALLRARIVGLKCKNVTRGMLSVWKPNDAVLDLAKEGNWIEIMNVVPTGIRNSEIQISAGRQSVFRTIKPKEDKSIDPMIKTLKRTCYHIKDISQNPSMTTEYNEIDTVGLIFSIEPSYRDFESNKNQFQNVFLADADKNMICVNFWGGIKKFGFENVLDTGQVIFCGNLQKRFGNTRRNVLQYRATEFSTFTKSPKNNIARDSIDEMNRKLFGLDRRKFCEDCVAIQQNYSVLKCFDDCENVSPYRFHNNSAYNLGKNKMYIETPKGLNTKKDDFDLSGLDFESSFKQQETQLSPKTLLRKKQVQEKIAKLKMYGEPPPLSPINIKNISKNAANSYKSPLLSNKTDAAILNKSSDTITNAHNSTTPKKVHEKLDKASPIILMNRNNVKRVNPVKLIFSDKHNVSDNVDHFAEEFDGSPPLSLD